LEETSKPNEEKSEKSSEENKDESVEEPQSEPEVQSEKETKESTKIKDEEIAREQVVEKTKEPEDLEEPQTEEKVEITSEEATEEQPEEEPAEIEETKEETEKPVKIETKKEKPKKKHDRGPDFKYIVRLSNTDVDGEKNVVYGLTSIKGIGVHMATLIADETGIDRYIKMGYLTDAQIEKLQEIIDNVNKNAPGWMLNHRKDYDTGDDIHLIGSDIDMRLRDEINILKKIRSYRGIRHERGLPVRGQRTRANSRTGLTLGVSKKSALSKSSSKKE
jgi:small subunit ribosomal protein S13